MNGVSTYHKKNIISIVIIRVGIIFCYAINNASFLRSVSIDWGHLSCQSTIGFAVITSFLLFILITESEYFLPAILLNAKWPCTYVKTRLPTYSFFLFSWDVFPGKEQNVEDVPHLTTNYPTQHRTGKFLSVGATLSHFANWDRVLKILYLPFKNHFFFNNLFTLIMISITSRECTKNILVRHILS